MEDNNQSQPQSRPRRREREERPKNNIKEDLDYRIKGLEDAKSDPAMSRADVAALDRVLIKLREKKAEKEPKQENPGL
ncbi:MAG: hypothetical protein KW804_00930 [Candidatus Doudnabacteria bacterium]|nr:hypothetical protein [Candidatus Doudnabacteria bacterium]